MAERKKKINRGYFHDRQDIVEDNVANRGYFSDSEFSRMADDCSGCSGCSGCQSKNALHLDLSAGCDSRALIEGLYSLGKISCAEYETRLQDFFSDAKVGKDGLVSGGHFPANTEIQDDCALRAYQTMLGKIREAGCEEAPHTLINIAALSVLYSALNAGVTTCTAVNIGGKDRENALGSDSAVLAVLTGMRVYSGGGTPADCAGAAFIASVADRQTGDLPEAKLIAASKKGVRCLLLSGQ